MGSTQRCKILAKHVRNDVKLENRYDFKTSSVRSIKHTSIASIASYFRPIVFL